MIVPLILCEHLISKVETISHFLLRCHLFESEKFFSMK